MKIDLQQIDREQFMVHQHILNGEVLWLVQPQHIGCKWTQANKHFRSSLWSNDGELVSAAFPKFVNWGENPDNFPLPTSLKDTDIVEKVDGSLLIVSMWNGKLILRTRGTSDATKLDNGHELALFLQRHGKEVEYLLTRYPTGTPYSLLFEWVSPLQKIILNYGDQPDWFLVGGVNHDDYSLMMQETLKYMAEEYGFKRPPTYTFPSVENLMKDIEAWKGKEGVVVYSNGGQTLHKVKGAWYLALHRMKEEFGSIERLIDVWFTWGCPDYQTTEAKIVSQFDWELFQTIRGDLSRICDGWKTVASIKNGMLNFINTQLLPMGDPKDKLIRAKMAPKVFSSYGGAGNNRANFVFKMLDGRPLSSEDEKKLLYQVLKK